MSDFNENMHQIRFRFRPAPDPTGELTALPNPLAGFKGPTSNGRDGRRREGERRGKGKGRKGRGGEGKGRGREGDEGKGRRGRGHPRFLPGLTPLTGAISIAPPNAQETRNQKHSIAVKAMQYRQDRRNVLYK